MRHLTTIRRDPVESIHPVVRVHPVTGEKALWVNEEFVTGLVGFKEEESRWLVKRLVEHVVMVMISRSVSGGKGAVWLCLMEGVLCVSHFTPSCLVVIRAGLD